MFGLLLLEGKGLYNCKVQYLDTLTEYKHLYLKTLVISLPLAIFQYFFGIHLKSQSTNQSPWYLMRKVDTYGFKSLLQVK